MTTMKPNMQRAREAAADLFAITLGTEGGIANMRAGHLDDHRYVRAFADFERNLSLETEADCELYHAASQFAMREVTKCALGVVASDKTQERCEHCTDITMPCFKIRRLRSAVLAVARIRNRGAATTPIAPSTAPADTPIWDGIDLTGEARSLFAAEFPGGYYPDDPAQVAAGAIRALAKALQTRVDAAPADTVREADLLFVEEVASLFNDALNEHGPSGYGRDTAAQKHFGEVVTKLKDDVLSLLASSPDAVREAVDPWLVEQLEAWPRRVDPTKTTNVEYLMKTAAQAIRSRTIGGGV